MLSADGYHICDEAQTHMEEIAKAFGADTHKPSYLERLCVGETEICFIYTPDDCTIFKGQQNANVCSLIFTVAGKTQRALFTGDAFRRSLQMCVWRFGKELKCDILQLPHHGLCDTGLLDFYKAADAQTVLVPISKAGDRSMHSGEHRPCDTEANLWAEQNAKTVCKAFEGNTEFEI
jgi:beta-lactamase superfamily II metal-dependent hydrolase